MSEASACLKPSRPDQRHPVNAGASAPPLRGLDGLPLARQGLARQLRLNGKWNASSSPHGIRKGYRPLASVGPLKSFWRQWQPVGRHRRQQVFLRSATTARLSDFRSALTRCCSFDGPREGASEWRRKRKAKGLARPMTTDRALVCRLTHAFCELRKPSVDRLPANRPSLQPPPMTTNQGHDRVKFVSYNPSIRLVCAGDGQAPGANGQGLIGVGAGEKQSP